MRYDEVIKKINDVTLEKYQDVYVIASINNKGNHIGRIKNILLDADGDIVIDVDIDKISVTG